MIWVLITVSENEEGASPGWWRLPRPPYHTSRSEQGVGTCGFRQDPTLPSTLQPHGPAVTLYLETWGLTDLISLSFGVSLTMKTRNLRSALNGCWIKSTSLHTSVSKPNSHSCPTPEIILLFLLGLTAGLEHSQKLSSGNSLNLPSSWNLCPGTGLP